MFHYSATRSETLVCAAKLANLLIGHMRDYLERHDALLNPFQSFDIFYASEIKENVDELIEVAKNNLPYSYFGLKWTNFDNKRKIQA